MDATILRSEVLKKINTGDPFDLEFVTANRHTGKGGEVIKVQQWAKVPGSAVEEKRPGSFAKTTSTSTQRETKTILLHNPQNRATHPIPVHIRLITFYNDKRIING